MMTPTNFNQSVFLDHSIEGSMSLKQSVDPYLLNDDEGKMAFIEDAITEYDHIFFA